MVLNETNNGTEKQTPTADAEKAPQLDLLLTDSSNENPPDLGTHVNEQASAIQHQPSLDDRSENGIPNENTTNGQDQTNKKSTESDADNQTKEASNVADRSATSDDHPKAPKSKRTKKETDPNMKKKKMKKWCKNSVVDKNKLTMFDLISYNPPVNDKQPNENAEQDAEQDAEQTSIEPDPNSEDQQLVEQADDEEQTKSDSDDEDESIGPRVKINENGEIVLDEASLIVKRKKPKDQDIKTVYEDDKTLSTKTNYSSFKKPGKTSEKKLRWTDDETVKFYTALTIIGTDFTLMSELFFRDQRSRVDLKNKFKQEEKFHKVLIDNALKKSDLSSIQNLECFNFDLLSSDDSDTDTSKTTTKDTATNNLTSTTAS